MRCATSTKDSVTTVMAFLKDLPAGAKVRKVRTARFSVLRADTATGKLSLDDYCRRRHVLVTYAGDLCGTGRRNAR
jgi:LysR family transcriptional activator of mexEF-oprN operon